MLHRLYFGALLVACSSAIASEGTDPRFASTSPSQLRVLIQQTPLASPLHARITARGSTSGLQRLAYDQYTLLWKAQPENGHANLRRGIAAKELWQRLFHEANSKKTKLSPEFYRLWAATRTCLSKAVRLLPESSAAHVAYGFFLWQWDNQMGKGLSLLRKAVALDPKDARAHANLGAVHANRSGNAYDPRKAEEELRLATRLDPTYAYPHSLLIQFYVHQRRYSDAQKEVRAYLGLVPASRKAAEQKKLTLYQSIINRNLTR